VARPLEEVAQVEPDDRLVFGYENSERHGCSVANL
jgi:hypothetical protein